MNIGDYFQQGDVIIEKIGDIPTNAKSVKPRQRGHVLADGEVTGHAHTIAKVKDAKLLTDQYEKMFLEVFKETDLTHEEHGKITLPEGRYTVRRVREYDPFEDEIRDVQD